MWKWAEKWFWWSGAPRQAPAGRPVRTYYVRGRDSRVKPLAGSDARRAYPRGRDNRTFHLSGEEGPD